MIDNEQLEQISHKEYNAKIYLPNCVKCGKEVDVLSGKNITDTTTECVKKCCGISYIGWKKKLKEL